MKPNFAFTRTNFILLAIGMAIAILGFVLMSGPGSNETTFNPDIFNTLHIKVAPVITFFGYLFIIVAILYKKKDKEQDNQQTENK